MNELLQQIFNLEDPIGRTIVYWIRVFFWVGVINYGVHIVRIIYESVCLISVRKYIKNNQRLGEIDIDSLNLIIWANPLIIRMGILFSAIYRRIRDLVTIKQSGGEIDHDVLGDIHAGAASRKAGLSNYILGVLIILGLVGTLWGLTTAVIEVQPLLQDIDDLDQLPQISNALQETLKGMGTAFKTTLAGLVTSLGLGALGWLFALSNSAFLTHFETVVATEIIPYFKQTPESTIESSMDRLQVSVGEFQLATEDNVRRMQESIQQLTEKSWDEYLEQQYVIANELGEIPGELRESLGGIANELGEIPRELRESLGRINEYQVLIRSTVESFEKMTENFITEISKHQSTVDAMVSDFKELTTQSMSQVSEYQQALQEGLENAVPQLTAESEALKATIRESQESQAKIIEYLVDTLKRRVQSLTDGQQNMQEGLRESVDIIVSDFKNLTTQSMSQVSEYQAALLEGLENVVSEFKGESAGLKTAIREAQSSQEKFVDELANNLAYTLTNTLKEQLQLMLQPIVENQQDMVEGLHETVANISEVAGELQIRSALERQSEVFEGIKSELIQSRQEIGNRLSQLIDEIQITRVPDTHDEVFRRIEIHLEAQLSLVNEQMQIMQTLDSSVKQLQQTFSKAESDEHRRTENMSQQLTQGFDALG